MSALELARPAAPIRPRGPAVAAKGFRPFFLLAGAFAALMLPLWLAVLLGAIPTSAYLAGADWHAHEMVFGFAVAVVAGFLLTAVGNWTKRETATGAPLLALAALWIAGRAAIGFAGALPRGVAAAVDLAFLPAFAVAIARPLVAAKSRRNFVMIAVLAALFAANAAVHASALGAIDPSWARRGSVVGVDVVVLVVVVITGRVVASFTRNATGATSIRSSPRLDALAVVATAAFVALDAAAPDGRAVGVAAAVAAVFTAARAWRWGARRAVRVPLLWILHVGHAWVPAGLALRAAAAFDPAIPRSAAVHALTVGAIGALTLGMMARVSLGHTGRPIVAPRPAVAAFVAMVASGLLRVLAPIVAPEWYQASLVVAGALFAAAFATFVVVYAPILTSPRVDGRPG